jgi:rhodanese-related sulfurtransferase
VAKPPLLVMTPEKLVECLRQGELRSGKLVLVDVRDEDRSLGYIIGSHWLPSEEFYKDVAASVDSILKTYASAKKFVFHCQLSKIRGPSCASLFREEVARNHPKRAADTQVYVLEGGFQAFASTYGRDEDLVSGV